MLGLNVTMKKQRNNIVRVLLFMSIGIMLYSCATTTTTMTRQSQPLLNPDDFKHYVDYFNGMEDEDIVNLIPNVESWLWMKDNIPIFECPDKDFERIYYFRWWTFRKHIKQTPNGIVMTEFIRQVGHGGLHNTISCALSHHIYEGRWLKNQDFLKEYILFWFRGQDGGPQKHFHGYSSWIDDSLYNRYLVDNDREFLLELLPDLISDYQKWEQEKLLDNGLFWQYDGRDGMEMSVSGLKIGKKYARPTINSYMYGNALAITKIAEMAGKPDIVDCFRVKAASIRELTQANLWDPHAKFFKVRFDTGLLSDAREAIGFIPWYFNLPDPGYEEAWKQVIDPNGFKAPCGLTTAERRHPRFRAHRVGGCEWDGAVWPFATTQTLISMANVLRNYKQSYVSTKDYFDALLTYAGEHQKDGKPYIGEYHDEKTGAWLRNGGKNPRSRYYNHSSFCDLVITGLVGICPQADDSIVVHPLVPADTWEWFALDNVSYHGRKVTVIWDKTGKKYKRGRGLSVFVDGKLIAHSKSLERIESKI